MAIKNRPPGQGQERAARIVSPDALALVRFGLRAADDPRILDTLRVIDTLLKVETPAGPSWHRYNDDGYGEHADGSPFDGTGIGRAWPLIAGERAHYELAAGNTGEAKRLARALEGFAGGHGLIPEQTWDSPDIPGRELYFGKPSGSAMPLLWAHAEYIKLLRSLRDGRVFDLPPQAAARYARGTGAPPSCIWRFGLKVRTMPAGKTLRIEVPGPSVVQWGVDGGRHVTELATHPTGFGGHAADLPSKDLRIGTKISFTIAGDWGCGPEREEYSVAVT